MSWYLSGPQAPGTTGPRYTPPKSHKPKAPKAPKRPHRKVVNDPLAPLSDQQLRDQAQQLVNQQIGPLQAQAAAAIEARSRSGSAAIQGYTSALSQDLGKYADRARAAYGQAQASQGANANALHAALGGAGTNLGSELGAKLTQIGAPAEAQTQVAGGAVQMGQGAANAGLAQSTANLDRLATEGGATEAYASALPGIAALTGAQHIRDLQAQLSDELAKTNGDLSTQAQTLLVDIFEKEKEREFQKALARQSGQFKNAQAEADAVYKSEQIAYKKATLAYNKAKAKADRQEKAREANQRASTANKNAQTSAQRAAEQRRHNRKAEAQAKANEKGRNKRSKKKNKTSASGY